MRIVRLTGFTALLCACVLLVLSQKHGVQVTPVVYAAANDDGNLDSELAAVLSAAGFTGNIEQTFHDRLEANLGRPINSKLAKLGRLLWFEKIHSPHHDNPCGAYPSAPNGVRGPPPLATRRP